MKQGAILVAGGASRRMGVDKAFLEVQGRPLLAHVAARLLEACDLVVVVARPRQPLPSLPEGVVHRVDPESAAGGGPLVGLVVGLEALAGRAELAYLSAADAVLVTPAHIERLLAVLTNSAHIEAVLPEDADGRVHPLAGAVRIAPALAASRRLLACGERRAGALYKALRTRRWPAAELPDPRVLAPCNTRDEWTAALRTLAGGQD